MLTEMKRSPLVLGAALLAAALVVLPITADQAHAAEQPIASDNPLSGNAEAIEKGRKTFNTFCAQCHGPEADGVAPRFGRYAADLRRFNKGFYQFVGIVVEGIVDKQMPPWGEYLDGDQIAEIGAYLETLAIEGAKWSAEQ